MSCQFNILGLINSLFLHNVNQTIVFLSNIIPFNKESSDMQFRSFKWLQPCGPCLFAEHHFYRSLHTCVEESRLFIYFYGNSNIDNYLPGIYGLWGSFFVSFDFCLSNDKTKPPFSNEIYVQKCIHVNVPAFSSSDMPNLQDFQAKKRPSLDFMERVQKDINPSMRAILIDWLVEVNYGSWWYCQAFL